MKRFCLLVLVSGFSASAAAEEPQPGLWEYTVKMEIPGMPAMPPVTTQQCLKAEDAKKGKGKGMALKEDQGECKFENQKQSGNKTSFDMICTGENAGKTHMDTTITATSMLQEVTTTDMDGEVTKHTSTGKRIGECK